VTARRASRTQAAGGPRFRLCDAVNLAGRDAPDAGAQDRLDRVDDGLLAPEDLPKLFDRLAA